MTHAEALRLFVEGDDYQWVDACGLANLRFNGDKKAVLAAARGSHLAQIGVLETTVRHSRWYFLVPEVRFEWLTCGSYPCSPGDWKALVYFLQVHLGDILPRASKRPRASSSSSSSSSLSSLSSLSSSAAPSAGDLTVTDQLFEDSKSHTTAVFGRRPADIELGRCVPQSAQELKSLIRALLISGKLKPEEEEEEEEEEPEMPGDESEKTAASSMGEEAGDGDRDGRLREGRRLGGIRSYITTEPITTGRPSAKAKQTAKPRLRHSLGSTIHEGASLILKKETLLCSASDILELAKESSSDNANLAILPIQHRASLLGSMKKPDDHFIILASGEVAFTLEATKAALQSHTTCEAITEFMNALTKMPSPNKAKGARHHMIASASRANELGMTPTEFAVAIIECIGEYVKRDSSLLLSEKRSAAALHVPPLPGAASSSGDAADAMPDANALKALIASIEESGAEASGSGDDEAPFLDLRAPPFDDAVQEVVAGLLKESPIVSAYFVRCLIEDKDELQHIWAKLKRKLHVDSHKAKVKFMIEVVRNFCNLSWRSADQVAELSTDIGGVYGGYKSHSGERFLPNHHDFNTQKDATGHDYPVSDGDDEADVSSADAVARFKALIKGVGPFELKPGDKGVESVGATITFDQALSILEEDKNQVKFLIDVAKETAAVSKNNSGSADVYTIYVVFGGDNAEVTGRFGKQGTRNQTTFGLVVVGKGIAGSNRRSDTFIPLAMTNSKDNDLSFQRYCSSIRDSLPLERVLKLGDMAMNVKFVLLIAMLDYPAAVAATGATSFLSSSGARPLPTSSCYTKLMSLTSTSACLPMFPSITNHSFEWNNEIEGQFVPSGREVGTTGQKSRATFDPHIVAHGWLHGPARVLMSAVCRSIDAMTAAHGSAGPLESFKRVWKDHSNYDLMIKQDDQTGQYQFSNQVPTAYLNIMDNWDGFIEAMTAMVEVADPDGAKEFLDDILLLMELLRGALLCFILHDEKKAGAAAYFHHAHALLLHGYQLYLFCRVSPSLMLMSGEGASRVARVVNAGLAPRLCNEENVENAHQYQKELEKHANRGGHKSEAQSSMDVLIWKLAKTLHKYYFIPNHTPGNGHTPQQRVKSGLTKAKRHDNFHTDFPSFVPGNVDVAGEGTDHLELFGAAEGEAQAELQSFVQAINDGGGEDKQTVRVKLESLRVGPVAASGVEDDGLFLHFYFGKSRQQFEITDGLGHKVGFKVHVDHIYKWHADGNTLHLQLAAAPQVLLQNQKNVGVAQGEFEKYFNLKVEGGESLPTSEAKIASVEGVAYSMDNTTEELLLAAGKAGLADLAEKRPKKQTGAPGAFHSDNSVGGRNFKRMVIDAIVAKQSNSDGPVTLADQFKKWRAHWLQQKPTLMMKSELGDDAGSRIASIFQDRKDDFKAAKKALGEYKQQENRKYTATAIAKKPLGERQERRNEIRRCLDLFRQKKGSIKYHCQFCFKALYLKHPKSDGTEGAVPRPCTVAAPHGLHEYCERRTLYGLDSGAGDHDAGEVENENENENEGGERGALAGF